MKKIGVWGWWDGCNLGDNWILNTMFKIFGKDIVPVNLQVTDFSGFDFMICGGGGLFSDWVKPPWNKKDIGVPYGIFCIGTEFGVNKKELQRLVSTSEFFYVRDKMTHDRFGLQDPIKIAGDVTFFDPILPQKTLASGSIALIWWKNFDELYNWKPVWSDYIGNYIESTSWEKELTKKGNVITFDFNTSTADPIPFILGCSLVVSQRYHGIIAAIQMGIPVIAIDICPKIRAIMQEADLEEYCLRLNEFYKFSLVYEKCMDERKAISEKMHVFALDKAVKVRLAADNAKCMIEEVLWPE